VSGILAYTTEVSAPKSVGEIISMLSQAKAGAIMQEFDGVGNVTVINFRIKTQFGEMTFRLPANVRAVDACLKEQYRTGKISRRYANDSQHSRRVAWRILRYWLEAQLALITVGLAKPEEVFLPYAQNAEGKTVFETLEEQRFTGLALPAPNQSVSSAQSVD
jgi:hypothetical protein